LTIEQVSSETRIPLEHLRALEDGRIADLPAGPYADAYRRTLEDHLDLPLGARVAAPVDTSTVPLWAVRWVAGTAVLLVFGMVGWQTWRPSADSTPEPEVLTEVPALELRLRPRRSVPMRVTVDDAVAHDGDVAGGQELSFAGDRIAVELPAVDAVRLEYDGQAIVPQGRQDAPRRLVFIDDLGAER